MRVERSVVFWLTVVAFGAACVVACSKGLPEPESEGAKLYTQYCSGQGCHGPIPPGTDSMGYWNNQYPRMIELMREQGWPLPSPEEDATIRAYIQKHAYK